MQLKMQILLRLDWRNSRGEKEGGGVGDLLTCQDGGERYFDTPAWRLCRNLQNCPFCFELRRHKDLVWSNLCYKMVNGPAK